MTPHLGGGVPAQEPRHENPDGPAWVDAAGWKASLRVVERLDVWSWRERYESTLPIMDGTQWELRLRLGDREMHASGSNAYPGSEEPEPSKEFRSFLRAVRKLVGGREVR